MKKALLVTVLAMALGAAIPATAQVSGGVDPADPPASDAIQYDNSSGCKSAGATPFGHVPGEFLVLYYSEEFETLRFEEIASIPDPCERLAAEEAKLRELQAQPGVRSAGLNGYGYSLDPEPIGPG